MQPGRLGDEPLDPEFLKQVFVATGLRGTPGANRHTRQVRRGPYLTKNLFAGVAAEVEVHQDQVRCSDPGIRSLSADEIHGESTIRKVNHLEWKILFLQRAFEKKDVGGVVFNHEDPGHHRSVFHVHSSSIIPQKKNALHGDHILRIRSLRLPQKGECNDATPIAFSNSTATNGVVASARRRRVALFVHRQGRKRSK